MRYTPRHFKLELDDTRTQLKQASLRTGRSTHGDISPECTLSKGSWGDKYFPYSIGRAQRMKSNVSAGKTVFQLEFISSQSIIFRAPAPFSNAPAHIRRQTVTSSNWRLSNCKIFTPYAEDTFAASEKDAYQAASDNVNIVCGRTCAFGRSTHPTMFTSIDSWQTGAKVCILGPANQWLWNSE